MTRYMFALAGLAALVVALGAAMARADEPAKPPAAQELADTIDRLIAAEWKAHNVKPAPVADDAEFCRRVYLDIAGRIPRVSESLEFLEDKDPNKRAKLVDRLLDSAGYVAHFTNVWRAQMVPQANNNFQLQFLVPQFENWLKKQLRDNTGYDAMVREILTQPVVGGGGRGFGQPQNPGAVSPIAFFQANEQKAENLAASTSRLFLGVKLECAQCHDHPFQADLKRKKFWEYAAFFSGIRTQGMGGAFGPVQDDPKLREIKIPNTDKTVQAKFLDGNDPQWEEGVGARKTLATWMTAKDNPYFAKATVNKLWAHFLGLGLIEPLDEPGPDNPPSHPELLDALAKGFVANDFDLKFVIRAITLSKTYQLTSTASDDSQDEVRLFARAHIKGLTPEQLFDSLALATGYREQANPNQRFGFFGPNNARGEFLQKFANHQDKKTEVQTSILQALSLMNGKFIADATSLERSETLAAIIEFPSFTSADRIEKLYLATVSRKPRPQELERLVKYVDKGGAVNNPKAALADVFWALLNSSEFILNH